MTDKVPKPKIITATYNPKKEWKMDRKGYFLILPNYKKKLIMCRHYTKNGPTIDIHGKIAKDVYNTIIRKKLVSSMQHAAYLGKELGKAEMAIQFGLKYVQDTDLDKRKKAK